MQLAPRCQRSEPPSRRAPADRSRCACWLAIGSPDPGCSRGSQGIARRRAHGCSLQQLRTEQRRGPQLPQFRQGPAYGPRERAAALVWSLEERLAAPAQNVLNENVHSGVRYGPDGDDIGHSWHRVGDWMDSADAAELVKRSQALRLDRDRRQHPGRSRPRRSRPPSR
jgi:hypothetical protein